MRCAEVDSWLVARVPSDRRLAARGLRRVPATCAVRWQDAARHRPGRSLRRLSDRREDDQRNPPLLPPCASGPVVGGPRGGAARAGRIGSRPDTASPGAVRTPRVADRVDGADLRSRRVRGHQEHGCSVERGLRSITIGCGTPSPGRGTCRRNRRTGSSSFETASGRVTGASSGQGGSAPTGAAGEYWRNRTNCHQALSPRMAGYYRVHGRRDDRQRQRRVRLQRRVQHQLRGAGGHRLEDEPTGLVALGGQGVVAHAQFGVQPAAGRGPAVQPDGAVALRVDHDHHGEVVAGEGHPPGVLDRPGAARAGHRELGLDEPGDIRRPGSARPARTARGRAASPASGRPSRRSPAGR